MLGWVKKAFGAGKAPEERLAAVFPRHLAGDLKGARAGYESLMKEGSGDGAPFLYATAVAQLGWLEEAAPVVASIQGRTAAIAAEIGRAARGGEAASLLSSLFAAGEAFKKAGKVEAALMWYEVATLLQPESAEAFYRYGDTLHDLRRYNDADAALEKARSLDPQHWGAWYTSGVLYQDVGRDADAIGFYERALALFDGHAKLRNNLGSALLNVGRSAEALEHFQQAVQLDARLPHAHANLGTAYNQTGRWREALASFEKASALGAPAGTLVKHAMVLPPVPASTAEIAEARERLRSELAELASLKVALQDPVREVGIPPFYLAYHGQDDLPLMREIADFYLAACPRLQYVAPHCIAAAPPGGRIRIGFLSTFLYDHTVGRYFHRAMRALSRERFEVVVISTFTREDEVTRAIVEDAAETVVIPMHLAAAQQAVERAALDVLVYADIGMEPVSYFLAFSRLAPVQMALYGHPDTTGIPNVDYFISHEECEPPQGEAHYSERLLRLPKDVAYTCFDRPAPSPNRKTRAGFGLDEAAHLYVCPQSLFKIHPDMDQIFAAILSADPQGLLLLPEGAQPEWSGVLRERLQLAGGDEQRLRFLPRMGYGDFIELLRLCDVVLDTVHFSGGATTLDAFATGTPIVTLPGSFMRGRQTLACYRRMGIVDLVAEDVADYVEKAVRLACDREAGSAMRRRIEGAAESLYGDLGMVAALERLIEGALAQKWEGKAQ